MRPGAIKGWYLAHKWSSLICTLFLLMLCVTGLPLIFHDEIDRLADDAVAMAGSPSSSDAPDLQSLDAMLAKARAARPGEVPLFMAFDNHSPQLTVTTAPRPDSPERDMTLQIWDRATGKPLTLAAPEDGVMDILLQLHTDLFLGLGGMLFLGAMGALFVVAIVSGVVLYAPFMRKLSFGTLRTGRSTRLKWIDAHNLVGIVTLAWASVVGITGVIHTLSTPIVDAWRSKALADMTAAHAGRGALDPTRYSSLDRALASARAALPGARPQFIAFPGGVFSTSHHYAVFFQGDTPLTEGLLTPALIDAETGRLAAVRPMSLPVKALQLSRPLHFGDYGGLPLKMLWGLLDLATILVLGSGLYLWLGKRRAPLPERLRELETGGAAA